MECTDLLGETSLCQANNVLLYATGFLCSPSMHVQFQVVGFCILHMSVVSLMIFIWEMHLKHLDGNVPLGHHFRRRRYTCCSCGINSYTVKHAVFFIVKFQDRKLSVWSCNIHH